MAKRSRLRTAALLLAYAWPSTSFFDRHPKRWCPGQPARRPLRAFDPGM